MCIVVMGVFLIGLFASGGLPASEAIVRWYAASFYPLCTSKLDRKNAALTGCPHFAFLLLMIFRTHISEPPLSDFVQMMWFSHGYVALHALERVLPTGDMSLIVNLHENRTRVYDVNDLGKCRTMSGTLLVGVYSNFTVIDTEEQRSTFGVVFKPGGAFPFFRPPPGELQNTEESLDNFWGAEAGWLREQLLAATTPAAKFKTCERALLRRIVKPLERHPAVRFAVNNFQQCPNRAISTVTQRIGLSERRFIQVFADQVGLTPKVYCRLQRFQQVLRRISCCQEIDWTHIALSCGYFDQAHFNHDFRAFSGINPSTYVANKTQFQNHVVVQD
jgi:AraC-like DNA-binding protein